MQGAVKRRRPPRAGQAGYASGPRRARGSSLIEVVVALLVLSVAIVGAAGAQLKAMKFGQVSQQRSLAVMHAASISERMRANLAAASVTTSPYEFNFDYSEIPDKLLLVSAPACTAACTAEEIIVRRSAAVMLGVARAVSVPRIDTAMSISVVVKPRGRLGVSRSAGSRRACPRPPGAPRLAIGRGQADLARESRVDATSRSNMVGKVAGRGGFQQRMPQSG